MPQSIDHSVKEIKKLKLEEVVLFAINHVPQADPTTLKQFLELVNAGGTFGTITHEQILKTMRQVLKYVPHASIRSFMILIDLLEIRPGDQLFLQPPAARQAGSNAEDLEPLTFFLEVPSRVGQECRSVYGGAMPAQTSPG
jgi:hypothetical protein